MLEVNNGEIENERDNIRTVKNKQTKSTLKAIDRVGFDYNTLLVISNVVNRPLVKT